MESKRRIDPEDIHVAKRVRARRLELGMTQHEISERLGITYQQLQKYETAQNRISSGRLFKIASLLQVSPSWFFEGLPTENSPAEPSEISSVTWLRLGAKIARLPPDIRQSYIEFGRSLSRSFQD